MEVGTGKGYVTNLLSVSEKVKKVIGLDVDPDLIKHSSGKYTSIKISFEYYEGDQILYEDNMLDVVVSFQIIEHVQDDENYMSEMYRVLKMMVFSL